MDMSNCECEAARLLAESVAVLHIERPHGTLPLRVVRDRVDSDSWAIGDGIEGRRWHRRYGWVYEPPRTYDEPLHNDMRYTLTEAVTLARELAQHGQ